MRTKPVYYYKFVCVHAQMSCSFLLKPLIESLLFPGYRFDASISGERASSGRRRFHAELLVSDADLGVKGHARQSGSDVPTLSQRSNLNQRRHQVGINFTIGLERRRFVL